MKNAAASASPSAAAPLAASADDSAFKEKLSPTELLVSAAVSGVITKTACAPLDRVRLLYQVQGMFLSPAAQSAASASGLSPESPSKRPLKYQCLLSSLKTVVREEGLPGLWRGNGVNSFRAALCYAIKFPTNDFSKAALGILPPASQGQTKQSSGGDVSLWKLLVAGAAAGTLQKAICYPLDLVSVRVAMGVNVKAPSVESRNGDSLVRNAGSSYPARSSLLSTVRSVASVEGLTGFYKGFCVTMVSGVPYVMLQMTFFDIAKRKIGNAADLRRQGASMWTVVSVAALAGSVASMSAQLFVFPFDTVRKRLMNDGAYGRPKLYSGTWDCLRQVIKSEGPSALVAGIRPAALRSLPAGALQFACYDTLKGFLLQRRQERP